MKCFVCGRDYTLEGKTVCSELCDHISKQIYAIQNEYTPTNGCDNCWGDLHQGCTERCKKEFQESHKLGVSLWHLIADVIQATENKIKIQERGKL